MTIIKTYILGPYVISKFRLHFPSHILHFQASNGLFYVNLNPSTPISVLGESSASVLKQMARALPAPLQPPKTKKTCWYYYINNTVTSNSIIPLFCIHIRILAVNLIPISTGVKKQDGKWESTIHTDLFSFHFKNIVVLITKKNIIFCCCHGCHK